MHQYSFLLLCVFLFSNNYSLFYGIKFHKKIFSKFYGGGSEVKPIKPLSLPQCIVNNKNKKSYCGNNATQFILNENPELLEKKLITISPGGYKGFYMLGITSYIKAHYDLSPDKYIFSGSSAGAWNALILSYKGDKKYLLRSIYSIVFEVNRDFKQGSIHTMQKKLRAMILNHFRDEDFAFDNLFIGVTHLYFLMPHTTIYTGFENLSDAVDCCMASSHIPILTGDCVNNYRGLKAFDGGFSKYPYLNLIKPTMEITPDIWSSTFFKKKGKSMSIDDFTTLFSKNIYDLIELFELGFFDTIRNKALLDYIFQNFA